MITEMVMVMLVVIIPMGPRREKTCLRGFVNNTGAEQPAHPRRLISAIVVRLSRSSISRLATSEISIFLLVSVAEETGLKLPLSTTPKTGFLVTRPNDDNADNDGACNNEECD